MEGEGALSDWLIALYDSSQALLLSVIVVSSRVTIRGSVGCGGWWVAVDRVGC